MKPNILDLRDERCPMALLLVKRHIKAINRRRYIVWVSDKSAQQDIVNYLHHQGFKVMCINKDSDYCLDAVKEVY